MARAHVRSKGRIAKDAWNDVKYLMAGHATQSAGGCGYVCELIVRRFFWAQAETA